MQEIYNSLLAYFRDNWPELVWIVIVAGVASYAAGKRSRLRWSRREFLDRLNVSLTSIDDGRLRIRTILEMDCQEVFLNTTATKKLVGLAGQTTADNPLIPIPKEDSWYYLNSLLNEISERFSEGQLRRDAGLPVHKEVYLLSLTCERAGPVRTQKIRGMLVRRDLLLKLPSEEPKYESPSHSTRWQTLQQLASRYNSSPHQFIQMEICF